MVGMDFIILFTVSAAALGIIVAGIRKLSEEKS